MPRVNAVRYNGFRPSANGLSVINTSKGSVMGPLQAPFPSAVMAELRNRSWTEQCRKAEEIGVEFGKQAPAVVPHRSGITHSGSCL